ncbi:MAG: TonB C-terminal domain-containing protein [bacterium]|nr:TonB C-terminal domain-containing protein [bacterium]
MDPRLRKRIIIASLLLHLLFFLLWEGGVWLGLFKTDIPKPVPLEDNPIVFQLQEPQRPRQVIETPDDAKVVEKQTDANFLSDKNALARNPESEPNLAIGETFARGDLDTHELPKPEGPRGETLKPMEPADQQEEKKEREAREKTEPPDPNESIIHTEEIVEEHEKRKQQKLITGVQDQLPTVRHDNQLSRALDKGGMSFNTYNWDFAPYMLMLKRRIQRNIYPPAAFTHLGLIDGDTLLRFRIYPDGRMEGPQILGYNGHRSLMVTSNNAVKASAPFPTLPENFPESYLEVTGKFSYFIRKK